MALNRGSTLKPRKTLYKELAVIEPTADEVKDYDFSPPDSEENIHYTKEGDLAACTFEKLIEKVASEEGKLIDRDTFFMTYQTYASPKEIVNAMVSLYYYEENFNFHGGQTVREGVLNVFGLWVENYALDFTSAITSTHQNTLKLFLNSLLEADGFFEDPKTLIASNILSKIEKGLIYDRPKPALGLKREQTEDMSKFALLLDYSALEIAQQMTMVEWNIWKKLRYCEFAGLAWTKKDQDLLSPNVVALVARFNDMSYKFSTLLLTTKKLPERVRVFVKLLEIAECLRDMGNYNGFMEVLSALQRGSCRRLKKTLQNLGEKEALRAQLFSVVDCSNHTIMRNLLKNRAQEPLLPYLGIYLTDLLFVTEANKDYIENNLLNVAKLKKIADIYKLIQSQQQLAFSFPTNPHVLSLLRHLPQLNEDQLYDVSYYLEPADGKETTLSPELLSCLQDRQMSELPSAKSSSGKKSDKKDKVKSKDKSSKESELSSNSREMVDDMNGADSMRGKGKRANTKGTLLRIATGGGKSSSKPTVVGMEFKDNSPTALPDFSQMEGVDVNTNLHSPRSTLLNSNGDNSRLVSKDGKEVHIPSAIDLTTVIPSSREATEKEGQASSPPISPRSFFSSLGRRNTEKNNNAKERQPIPLFRENTNNSVPSATPSAAFASTASSSANATNNAENSSCDGLGAGSGSASQTEERPGISKGRAISSPQLNKKFARLEKHIERKDSKELSAMSSEQRMQIQHAIALSQQQDKERLERERMDALKKDVRQSASEEDSVPFDDYTYSSHNIDIDTVGLSPIRREEPTGFLPASVMAPTEGTGGGAFVKPQFKRTVSKQETIARESRRIGKWRNEVTHKNAGPTGLHASGPESPRGLPSLSNLPTTMHGERIERVDSDREKDGAPVIATRPVAPSRAAGIAQIARSKTSTEPRQVTRAPFLSTGSQSQRPLHAPRTDRPESEATHASESSESERRAEAEEAKPGRPDRQRRERSLTLDTAEAMRNAVLSNLLANEKEATLAPVVPLGGEASAGGANGAGRYAPKVGAPHPTRALLVRNTTLTDRITPSISGNPAPNANSHANSNSNDQSAPSPGGGRVNYVKKRNNSNNQQGLAPSPFAATATANLQPPTAALPSPAPVPSITTQPALQTATAGLKTSASDLNRSFALKPNPNNLALLSTRANSNLCGGRNPGLRRSTSAGSIFAPTQSELAGLDFSDSEDADFLAKFPNPFEVSFRESYYAKLQAPDSDATPTPPSSPEKQKGRELHATSRTHSRANSGAEKPSNARAASIAIDAQAATATATPKASSIDPIDHWSRLEYIASILPPQPTRAKESVAQWCDRHCLGPELLNLLQCDMEFKNIEELAHLTDDDLNTLLNIEDDLKLGVKARFLKAVRELRGYYYVYYYPREEANETEGRNPSEFFRPLSEFASF